MDRVDRMAGVVSRPARLALRPFEDSSKDAGDAALIAARAAESGYLFFRRLVDASLVRQLRRDILAFFTARGWLIHSPTIPMMRGIVTPGAVRDAPDSDLTALQVQIQLLPTFRRLRADPSIAQALTAVMGSPPRAGFGDVCRIVPPNMLHRTTPPHQDHFYTRGSTSQWTVWIPVGACPVSLGGLVVWPGSHRDGLRAHDQPIEDGHAIIVEPEVVWHGASFRCGDVLMFNALTVHQARPNVTADQVRLSVDYRYVGEAATENEALHGSVR